MISRLVICLLAALAVAVSPGAALAADAAPADSVGAAANEPMTSLADLEDEVMCPVCGTLLGLSQAPQADRQRVLIERLIDEGLSKEEVKDELVAEYGPQVLALPDSSGFNLTAYLVPIIGLALAAVGLFFAVRRWRRETSDASSDLPGVGAAESGGEPEASVAEGRRAGGSDLSEDEASRLDRDLARYDF